MEEGKTYKLGDIASVQTGPFGSQLHNEDYVDVGTPIVTVEHLGAKSFSTQNLPKVSQQDCIRLSKYSLKEGDIVFSRVGSVDRCSYVSEAENGWLFSGRCLRVRAGELVYPEYLYYYFQKESVKQEIRNVAVGATMPSINTKLLSDLLVELPPYDHQINVAKILASIDEKIQLNNRINHNLEEQAQALYKSWFVDFEPFRDGQFVDSELGIIPKGWRVGTLSELGDIVAGGTPSKAKPEYYTNKGIAWLTPKDLSVKCNKFTARGETDITEEGYKNSSAKLMPRGSILFSSRAPIGYISIAKGTICTNQGFKSIVPTYAGTAYVYYWLRVNTDAIESQASGSTFKEASGSLMKSFPALVPEKSVLDSFEKEITPILNEQEILEEQIYHAEQIRDSLLPRLMSGELVMNC